ncbi:SLC13 family permease [Rubellimicrobium roseum]|uniref:SLC13 family permease n=1 Tax=Rubellimicrobium roseum TaxID=687525 RepID=A0A5C4NK25_9RHOB|nr:SLC13 family permease [Rubellimicrobium roseum]TNC74953.1 SLC13 family permease [Rubellimicrobium roseum]
MTLDQALAFGLMAVTIGLFIWGRLPYDLVAVLALVAGVLLGIIPADEAFSGFGDDVVIIVATALLVSAAVARSGAVETAMRPLLRRMRGPQAQVPVMAGAVTLLSMVTKNVGALAMLMPVATQVSRRTGTPLSFLLMPMAFGSLIGGIVTMVGTSPNILVSKVREDITGEPFGMFDYTPVGLVIAATGLVFLSFAYRVLPDTRRTGGGGMDAAFTLEDYATEARVPEGSPFVGRTVAELEALGEGGVKVTTVIRERFRRHVPRPDWEIRAEDVLLLTGEPEDLERVTARARLRLAGEEVAEDEGAEDSVVAEGVVTADSPLVGQTPAEARLRRHHGLGLLAVSRRNQRLTRRLRRLRLEVGDVLILKASRDRLAESLGELRILPLSERDVALGRRKRSWLPIGILAAAMVLVALHLVPVAVAFAGAAALVLLLRIMTMEEAYESIEWSVIVLLAALIPVSGAIEATGGTDLLAAGLERVAGAVPPLVALGLMIVLAMAVTPFLNNAATVLVMAPIAASLAQRLGLNPDPFLMAVAVGAACDFLTPIGHQCNTLVMGPGGYRFGDYWKLGLPLSILVVVVGTPLIAAIWGLGTP